MVRSDPILARLDDDANASSFKRIGSNRAGYHSVSEAKVPSFALSAFGGIGLIDAVRLATPAANFTQSAGSEHAVYCIISIRDIRARNMARFGVLAQWTRLGEGTHSWIALFTCWTYSAS